MTAADTIHAPADEPDEIVLRPALASDISYVLQAWLKGFGQNSELSRGSHSHYWTLHAATLLKLIDRCALMLAVHEPNPSTIIGFAVTETVRGATVVHWLQVRKDFWRRGIAKKLLGPIAKQERVIYTHRINALRDLPLPKSWTYYPYAVIGD